MARTIDYWYQQILAEKARQNALNGITSTSKISVFSLLAYVFAFAAWLMDSLMDEHFSEVKTYIDREWAHQPEWYKQRALEFQWGQTFNKAQGGYANTGLSETQIAAQKIIAAASVEVIETTTGGVTIHIKVARMLNGDLAPLASDQMDAFAAYMAVVKDSGDRLSEESRTADALKLLLDIWYDPLVLNGNGERIDGTGNTPVQDAINDFLRNTTLLPFNGEFSNTRLTDQLQLVDGVKLPVIKAAWAKYGGFGFTLIDEKYIPDAGYIRIANADLTINWRPYV